MSNRFIFAIFCTSIALGIFCTEPLNPLDITSNAGIEPQSLADSTFSIGDTVAITIHMNLPHNIDTIIITMHGRDSIIPCAYDRNYTETLIIKKVYTAPDTIAVGYRAILRDGTVRTASDTLIINGLPAKVETQPRDEQYITSFAPCTLSFTHTGNEPISYRWRKGTDELPDETTPDLVLAQPTPDAAGVYSCIISNPWGSDTTKPAVLMYREVNEGNAHWNFSTYQDSVHEGDTLHLLMRSFYTKPAGKEVTLSRLAYEKRCAFLGDSLFVFQPGRRDSGIYIIPVSIQSDTGIDIASITIRVKPTYCAVTAESDSGTVSITPTLPVYRWRDTITVEAIPFSGFTFFEWSGDMNGNNTVEKIVLEKDITIKAGFWPESSAECIPVEDGKLNSAIKEASPTAQRPSVLCPQPGLYGDGTVEIMGKVQIIIQ